MSSHILGGEITWECLSYGNDKGKLVFTLKVYRSCWTSAAGVSSTSNITNPLYATYGGPSVIACQRVEYQDISITCYDTSKAISCGNSLSGPGRFGIEEHIYVSAPTQINGIPSAQGSSFTWATCCRYLNTSNISGGSVLYIRSLMFPFYDATSQSNLSLGSPAIGPTCYDSSPKFAERPAAQLCAKYPEKVRYFSIDQERDSIHYDWTIPKTSSTTAVSWKTGYGDTIQYPGSSINSLNADPIMNHRNGTVSLFVVSPIGQYTHTGVKTESYRDGQKIAEVHRDMVAYIIDCDITTSVPQVYNKQRPDIEVKKASSTIYQKNYLDTIHVGSLVELDIRVNDDDSLPTNPVSLQSVRLKMEGDMLSNINNNAGACGNPLVPCAYLDTVGNPAWTGYEFMDTTSMVVRFKWNTNCMSLARIGDPENDSIETFTFHAYGSDNWCPRPGDSSLTITLTIIDTLRQNRPIDSVDASQGGAFIRWKKSKAIGFSSYDLFYRHNLSDPWSKLVTLPNRSMTTFYDPARRTDTNYVWYKAEVNGGNNCESYMIKTIYLDVSLSNNVPELRWTPPYHLHNELEGKYSIYRGDRQGNWTFLATRKFYDPMPLMDTVYWDNTISDTVSKAWYKIENLDEEGYHGVSNIVSLEIPVVVDTTDGIDEFALRNLKLYPNPTKDVLIISGENIDWIQQVEVLDLTGRLYYLSMEAGSSYILDVSSLENGLYILRLTDRKGGQALRKFLKY